MCATGALNTDEKLLIAPKTRLVVDNTKLYETWSEECPYLTFEKKFIFGSKFTDMIHEGKLEKFRMEDIGTKINLWDSTCLY